MPSPLTQWNPQIARGATFTASIGLLNADGDPVTGFSTAEWRLRICVPGEDAFYVSVSGDWVTVNDYTRMLTIEADVTAGFDPGNIQYTLDAILLDGTTIRDIIPRGFGSVVRTVTA